MSQTLIGTITDKAITSFKKPVTKYNFKAWYNHWIATGNKWAKELEAEGLIVTSIAVKEHVKFAENTRPEDYK